VRRLLLLISALLIFFGLLVPIGTTYVLLSTGAGLRFLVAHVPRQIGDVRLEVSGASGTIAQGVRIDTIEVDHPLVNVRVEGISARVELLPLLFQSVRTQDPSIQRLRIQVKRRTRPPIRSTPAFVPRWLMVSTERLQVHRAQLLLPGGEYYTASELYASATIRHHRIRLFQVGGLLPEARLAGGGELRAHDPLALSVHAQINWHPARQPAWILEASASGDLDDLQITSRSSAPFTGVFRGHALDLTARWHWLGNLRFSDLDIARWGGSPFPGPLSGQAAVHGSQNGFALQGSVTPTKNHIGQFDVSFEGAYARRVLWAKRAQITQRGTSAAVALAGTVEIMPQSPRLSLDGHWRDFRWPLAGKPGPFHSPAGEFAISGVSPYAVRLNGVAAWQEGPAIPTRLEGLLATDRFTVLRARFDLLEGHADLAGAYVWGPALWSFGGRVEGVNPQSLRPDLPGKLSFAVTASGQGVGADADFTGRVRDISGRLRGTAAAGSGAVARTGGAWRFDAVRLSLGGASAALDGLIDERLDLRFELSARDLSVLSADSRGQLRANGTITGTRAEPVIRARGEGRDIEHAGVSLQALAADVQFNPHPGAASRVTVQVSHLGYLGRRLDDFSLRLDGEPRDYRLQLGAHTLGLDAAMAAHGPYAQGVWHGQLSSTSLRGTQALHLELEHPVELTASTQSVHLERLCLSGQPASLCADLEWTSAQWHVTFAANELPLGTVTAGLTQAVEYSGRINVRGNLHGAAQQELQGTLRADLTDAQLIHRLTSGRQQRTSIGSGAIAIEAGHAAITADIGLSSGEIGTIQGSLSAQRTSSSWQSLPLRGALHAHTDQLDLITLYVPDIDRAAGHLDAELKLAGTLGAPLLDGELSIANGEIDHYQMNLGLRQVGFAAHLHDNSIDFHGEARIGSGLAHASGRLEWHDSLPHGRVQVDGSNLRVVDVPEAQIEASPSLQFNIDGRRIEAAGSVRVPYAKIVPADLTGAVRSSDDEVIVGRATADPASRFTVLSSITLSLGDRVSIDTAGLTGRLTGNITVRSGYEAVTSATGELSIEQGKYTAYARKLDIQRGRLIFTGGPVANPGIDIRAIKEFPDVIAGINVRGTLLQPRMSFFSDPSLSQSQIVSLILAGGSLESAQNRQAGAGYEALAQGGAILAQQLGSRVGIQDVSLESDLTNQTSLVLGRYLSPRLYVSYGVALTEQLNVLKLRYSLGDRWTIKTEVGQARGADLVYTIQR
jgi:translocation and assembly module TamB